MNFPFFSITLLSVILYVLLVFLIIYLFPATQEMGSSTGVVSFRVPDYAVFLIPIYLIPQFPISQIFHFTTNKLLVLIIEYIVTFGLIFGVEYLLNKIKNEKLNRIIKYIRIVLVVIFAINLFGFLLIYIINMPYPELYI